MVAKITSPASVPQPAINRIGTLTVVVPLLFTIALVPAFPVTTVPTAIVPNEPVSPF